MGTARTRNKGSFNLSINLLLNRISKVENYFVALSDKLGFARVPENANYRCIPNQASYCQSSKYVRTTTVDVFVVETRIVPDYIKIDVDGCEKEIVRGMKRVLANPKLKSLMIEINSDEARHEIEEILGTFGFGECPYSSTNLHNVFFSR